VLIVTFDLDNLDAESKSNATRVYKKRHWKPKILHNFDRDGHDKHIKVVDAAVRTSSAPTYFPSYQGYVDGGVAANNPSMCALAATLKDGVPISDIRLMSLGTGYNPNYIPGDRLDWGYKDWAPRLVDLFMDGPIGIADYQCRQVLNGCYHRVQPILAQSVQMDDAGSVPFLLEEADRFDLDEAKVWVECKWKEEVES